MDQHRDQSASRTKKRRRAALLLGAGLAALALAGLTMIPGPKPVPPVIPLPEPEAPARREPAPLRLLLVGDSLSLGVGQEMEKLLEDREDVAFSHAGKISSGLTRPSFFDWPANLAGLVRERRPDVVAVMLGANDDKSVAAGDGIAAAFASPQWDRIYASRARQLYDIARAANPDARVYFIGVPVMADASFAASMRHLNAVVSGMCAALPGCAFIDTWEVLGDGRGGFVQAVETGDGATGLRAKDGIHITAAGSRLLAKHILAAVASETPAPPAPALAPSQGGQITSSPRAAAATAKASPHVYRVRQGDTLAGLSRRFHVSQAALRAANPGLTPNRLALGQKLVIPAPSAARPGGRERHRPGRALWGEPPLFRLAAADAPFPAASFPAVPFPGKVLVVGDSFAVGIGMTLGVSLAAHPRCQVLGKGKTSSGLSSPRFHDWEASLRAYLDAESPDVLVVMIGANDAHNGSGSTAWREEYRNKAASLLAIATGRGVRVVWVGLPPMREAAFNQRVKSANEAMRAACNVSPGCRFLECWDIFSDPSGNYRDKGTIQGRRLSLRGRDGVHLTRAGYRLLTDRIATALAPGVTAMARPGEIGMGRGT